MHTFSSQSIPSLECCFMQELYKYDRSASVSLIAALLELARTDAPDTDLVTSIFGSHV